MDAAQTTRLLRWTEEVIWVWNWPLVMSGQLDYEELAGEIADRRRFLSRLAPEDIATCVLQGLPHDAFFHA